MKYSLTIIPSPPGVHDYNSHLMEVLSDGTCTRKSIETNPFQCNFNPLILKNKIESVDK